MVRSLLLWLLMLWQQRSRFIGDHHTRRLLPGHFDTQRESRWEFLWGRSRIFQVPIGPSDFLCFCGIAIICCGKKITIYNKQTIVCFELLAGGGRRFSCLCIRVCINQNRKQRIGYSNGAKSWIREPSLLGVACSGCCCG